MRTKLIRINGRVLTGANTVNNFGGRGFRAIRMFLRCIYYTFKITEPNIFGGRGEPPKPSPVSATACKQDNRPVYDLFDKNFVQRVRRVDVVLARGVSVSRMYNVTILRTP